MLHSPHRERNGRQGAATAGRAGMAEMRDWIAFRRWCGLWHCYGRRGRGVGPDDNGLYPRGARLRVRYRW
jgi:hypothetical protein